MKNMFGKCICYKMMVVISLLSLFTSCFKEDEMVIPHEQGDLQIGVVELGETYYNQIFYDLSTNINVSSNIISKWDLAFECDENKWRIILNAAQMMYVGNTHDTSFSNISSSSGLNMLFDKSDGDMDSTAIGEWYYLDEGTTKSYKYVYVIDRGMDENFVSIGKK
ncbi:MAG: HmuY family protein, partial [Bacteroidota bacterium]|nr:HmuY family protein [Bacteroidota bacterium]